MKQIRESFEVGDLAGVLEPKIHIDEFRSQIGKDDEIIVFSFLINDKTAAIDLVDFLERGYDFILDADISDSEMKPGSYLVFVEMMRRKRVIEHVGKILSDLSAATGLSLNEWKFRYMNIEHYFPLDIKNFTELVPLSARAYRDKFNQDIEEMKMLSGLPVGSFVPQEQDLKKLMIEAGIPIVTI